MKTSHEERFANTALDASDSLISGLAEASEMFWAAMRSSADSHPAPEFAVASGSLVPTPELFEQAYEAIEHLTLVSDGWRERPNEDLWDFRNLALPNWISRLRMLLLEIELNMLELQLQITPADEPLVVRLGEVRQELLLSAASEGYAD